MKKVKCISDLENTEKQDAFYIPKGPWNHHMITLRKVEDAHLTVQIR